MGQGIVMPVGESGRGDRFQELFDLLHMRNHPASLASGRWHRLEATIESMRSNEAELDELIDAFETNPLVQVRVMSTSENTGEYFRWELARRWSNYIGSAIAVEEHLRHLRKCVSQDLDDDFDDLARRRWEVVLKDDLTAAFVRELRNVMFHSQHPPVSLRWEFTRSTSVHSVVLVRNSLLGSDCDWKKGHQYIEEMAPEERLQEVHREYDSLLRSYLDWYRTEYETRYHHVFEEYSQLLDEYVSLGGVLPETPRDVGDDNDDEDSVTRQVLHPREALTVVGLAARAGWNWMRWRISQR